MIGAARVGLVRPNGVAVLAWNPADTAPAITLSNADLTATQTSTVANAKARAQQSKSSGLWYYEFTLDAAPGLYPILGLATASEPLATSNYLGEFATGVGYVPKDGRVLFNAVLLTTAPTIAVGQVAGIGFNFSTQTLLIKTGSTETTVSVALSGTLFPTVNTGGSISGDQVTLRTTSILGVPTGYTYWSA